LITNKGKKGTCKIIDFGAAKKFAIGTNEYMSELKGTVMQIFILQLIMMGVFSFIMLLLKSMLADTMKSVTSDPWESFSIYFLVDTRHSMVRKDMK